ncbi:hypothetical protein [Actinopolymorpha pittospori]|uniref:Uncharacterized protein n=1 Tax=Actinopolymorpha pittospori TaxID=648752 RepID=A0A927MWV7_9ACTN|nr:hypothetical protein [Actinopolymorpha pittospori]MBE1604720.1 hypothetical protein [Actinopolymorpha pittospori]
MARPTAQTSSPPLHVYLNDHLAGATGGVELLRRAARVHQGDALGSELSRLAKEVSEDRAPLIQVMKDLGVPVRRHKAVLGWLGEKVGRLKPNGRLISRSPVSDVLELELMRLGVEGKASCWRTLRVLADGKLDANRLNELMSRAAQQAEILEKLRTSAAADMVAR